MDVGRTTTAFVGTIIRVTPVIIFSAKRTPIPQRILTPSPSGHACPFLHAHNLSQRYGHDGPGIYIGDGQTETEGVPSQGGGDYSLMHMA